MRAAREQRHAQRRVAANVLLLGSSTRTRDELSRGHNIVPSLVRTLARYFGLLILVLSGGPVVSYATDEKGAVVEPGDVFNGIILPRQVADFVRGPAIDNEVSNPGLGVTIPYSAPNLKATVYVYDLRIPSIPEGPMSDIVRTLFDQSIEEVLATYGSTRIKDRYGTGSSSRGREFLCAEFEVHKDRATLDSYLFLTAHNGKFVKVRITAPSDLRNLERARTLANGIALSLWPHGQNP